MELPPPSYECAISAARDQISIEVLPVAVIETKDNASYASTIKKYFEPVKIFCVNVFTKIYGFICEIRSGFIAVFHKCNWDTLCIIFLLFMPSGTIVVPILDKANHAAFRRDWLIIHQECQCKYANITPLSVTTVVTCGDKVESVTFPNINTTEVIDITRTCFIEHPIKITDSIRYNNPCDTYWFFAKNRESALMVLLGIWFYLGTSIVLIFCMLLLTICCK
jgi:hypothetical protein